MASDTENNKTVKNNTKTQEQVNNQQPSEEKITIMPTMIDSSEEREEKRVDLSAIIPKFEDMSDNNNAVELNSKESLLKGDGAVLIALIDGNGEARLTQQAGFPEQIDIETRKKEAQRKKSGRDKKEKVKKNKKNAQKFQNQMALTSLIVIILLGGFYYWYVKHPTEKDFTPLKVVVEVGEPLPIRASSYVKPGVGKEVDELLYSIDKSQVVLEVPGDYPFTVTHNKVSKTGTISIVDTLPPELEVRNVTIVEGTSYDASKFVENCHDYSGCNYSFQDKDTVSKYNTSGVYVVYVVATDAFDNSVTQRANLIIEAQGDVMTYLRNTNFNMNTGYETTESYELHFNTGVLINGVHQIIYYYQSDEKYQEAKALYNGEVNYTIDDAQKTITFKENVSTVGSNYSEADYIEDYLIKEGFDLVS